MPYTVAAKVAAHQGLLDKIKLGSTGTACFNVYAGSTLLVSLPIDHAASAVSGSTGVLTLAPGAAGTGVAAGTATTSTLVARDGTVLEDAFPVEVSAIGVSGKLALSSLAITVGGTVTLMSASIG